ncbi:hypothetical protein BKA66DRAFT_478700 [Pyrenochaeta sp. MPI-SDFR-AT-0127]|nr:hypothetical protein BKA66DRAFT_478700 [Pyrenochaeta sp. MPI-SDFR-AT-0127]
MSFGFSVSDFILIAEKAYLVYNRCKDAPGKYAGLTRRVLELRDVLDDTKSYIVQADNDGQIPQSHLRLSSLHLMTKGCNTTLDEVDDFLEKYSDVGTEKGTRKVFSRLRFLTSDSEALEKKLELDASSLQLRLTSLTSLSVLNVKETLDRIAQEYRTGARQPSVISRPMVDDKLVEKEEMFEQISDDLEEKDVHPYSILLNKPFLEEWLCQIIENGGLDEDSIDPLPELKKEITHEPTLSTLVTAKITEGDPDTEETLHQVSPRPVSFVPPHEDQMGINGAAAPIDDDDDLYADPDSVTTMPENSFTVVERGFAPISTGEPRSRSNSTASSVGKPENWRPYDRPAPRYVQDKLRPLFHHDPLPDPSSEATKHRIMRAFHQADYSGEGFLTRRTVLQHLSATLAGSPMQISADTLENVVLYFDANRDGQFDDDEFLGLIQEMMRRTSQAKVMRIEAKFTSIVQDAKAKAASRRAMESKFFLHWGFSKRSGASPEYIDDILRVSVHEPPKVLNDSAFSVMAWEANICVNKISDFEERWLGIVPKSLQSEYRDPLRVIRGIARAFTLLENQKNRLALSDLDAFLTCVQLTSYLHGYRENKAADEFYSRLEASKLKCNFILDSLLGFTHNLERKKNFGASVHNFGKFQTWWKDNNITWGSDAAVNEFIDWDSVKETVTSCRAQRLLTDMEGFARMVVEDFASREIESVQKRKAVLVSAPWAGYFTSAEISGWCKKWVSKTLDRREVFLRISVTDPTQVIRTSSEKRTESNEWYFGYSEKSRIYLLPQSTITVAVMYVDSKRPEGIVKFEFPPRKPTGLDFVKRSNDSRYGTNNTLGRIRETGPPCDLTLSVAMDECPHFKEELESLKPRNWRTMLADNPFEADRSSSNATALATQGPAPGYTP